MGGVEELDTNQLLEDYDEKNGGDDEDKDTAGDKDAGNDDTSKTDDTDDTKDSKKDEDDTSKDKDTSNSNGEENKDVSKEELEKLAQQLKDSPLSDIDDDWIPKTYKELLEKAMEVSEVSAHNAKIKEEMKTKEAEKIRQEANALMDKEIADLLKDGKLPEVKDEMDKDDAGVKRQIEVYEYMAKLNNMYSKQGLSQRITSFQLGLTMLEAEEYTKKQKEDEDKQSELQKKRSSLTGGGTPSSAKGGDKGYNMPVKGESLQDAMEEVINSF